MKASLLVNVLGDGSLGYPVKLPLVLLLGVALLAESSSVNLTIGMLTIRCSVRAAMAVVATIAHATGVVLGIGVAALGNYGYWLFLAYILKLCRLWMVLSQY